MKGIHFEKEIVAITIANSCKAAICEKLMFWGGRNFEKSITNEQIGIMDGNVMCMT